MTWQEPEPEPPGGTYAGSLNRRRVTPDVTTDDVLSTDTIARIEELHTAVLWAEKERRFGMLRARRAEELRAAMSAEEEFLNEQGFATYNDYRLRIRRSQVERPEPVEPEPVHCDPVAPEPTATEEATPDRPAAGAAAGADKDQLRERLEDGPTPPLVPPPVPPQAHVPLGRFNEEWAVELRNEFDRRLSARVDAAKREEGSPDLTNQVG